MEVDARGTQKSETLDSEHEHEHENETSAQSLKTPISKGKKSIPHRYRGHRAESFITSDINELVEIRARQRTFDGAYGRTALGNLGYSLTVLKLFDRRFYRSLLYAILAFLLFIISFLRSQHSKHDFADNHRTEPPTPTVIKTRGQTGKRNFGRPFVTAGWIVVAVSVIVATVEIALLVLVLQL